MFATKLDASGAALGYSTYLGGSGTDYGSDLALDAAGETYLTGNTYSADFPTTPGAFDTTYNDASDVFVTKLAASGAALGYSTYLGGSDNIDYGRGIAIDSAGSAYLTGNTASHDFPTTRTPLTRPSTGTSMRSERSSTQAAPPSSIPPTWAVTTTTSAPASWPTAPVTRTSPGLRSPPTSRRVQAPSTGPSTVGTVTCS